MDYHRRGIQEIEDLDFPRCFDLTWPCPQPRLMCLQKIYDAWHPMTRQEMADKRRIVLREYDRLRVS